MRQAEALYALNRGEVSLLSLARLDIEHLRLAAQSQINWLPRVLGPAMLRPGSGYIGQMLNNQPANVVSYVASFNDTALLEFTSGNMRVWRNDALVTRAAVATAISPFQDWMITVTGTATGTGVSNRLTFADMNNGAMATASVAVGVAAADQQTEHALRFTVANGPVTFAIGTVAGLGDIFAIETLDTGTYSMAFTPGAGTVYVTFAGVQLPDNANTLTQSIPTWAQAVEVTGIFVEPPGVLILPTPWTGTAIGVPGVSGPTMRTDQSGDVVYIANTGQAQMQINRYSPTSWSIVVYRPVKGPLNAVPSNASINLTPSAYAGNITLTASGNLFSKNDVGTLFRLFNSGQNVVETLSFENTFSDAIEVTGVSYVSTVDGSGNVHNAATVDRNFTINISGTWVGTITLQRSFTSATTGFSDYATYTGNQTNVAITDGLNNEIVWYQIGFKSGNYTSGEAVVSLTYSGGGNYGVCHVTGYVSPTQVQAEVLVPFWSISSTSDWLQSEWSTQAGYPTAVALHQGRLWWSGADKWWGSVSDDYSNFDFDAIGDAAPIDQRIGQGPIANINWMVSIDHLIAGADTSIITAISDAIESPLTPSNFNLRRSVTNGSAPIQARAVDQRVVYVDQSNRRLYDLIYDIRLYNYRPSDLTRLNPDIGLPGFLGMAVQRQPDTRINLWRTDGILVSFIYDVDDDVQAFWRVQTSGTYEGCAVLPGPREDQVYVVANRTINGQTVRYLEKFARIDECQCGVISKCVDAHLVYQGGYTGTLAGFLHLVGQTVCIWGQGVPSGSLGDFNDDFNDDFYLFTGYVAPVIGDWGTAVVSGTGTVTIPGNILVNQAVVGLYYQAEFISAKLEYAARMGSPLNVIKRIDHIGFSLVASHSQGLRYGKWTPNDEQNVVEGIFTLPPQLDPMPQVEYAETLAPNAIWEQFDSIKIEFGADFDTDLRIYLQAASPRPVTVAGVSFDIQTSS